MARIVVVGSTNVDMVVQAPRIPRPGETVLGGEFSMIPGGKGANQAVAAARLGADVTFVARVGADSFGEQALRLFQAEGIRTDYVVRDPTTAHGVALILVDERGQNAIAVAPGANARVCLADVDAAEPAIAEADTVLLQLEVPLPAVARAIGIAKKHGKRVILNPAPYAALPDEVLAGVDVLTPNETEAEMLSGVDGSAEQLIRRGVGCLVVTLGAEGVLVVDAEGQCRVRGQKVNVVDTTAAGDAFSGALAVFMSEGIGFREAVRWAVAVSALSVTRLGAQSSLPTRREMEEFVEATGVVQAS